MELIIVFLLSVLKVGCRRRTGLVSTRSRILVGARDACFREGFARAIFAGVFFHHRDITIPPVGSWVAVSGRILRAEPEKHLICQFIKSLWERLVYLSFFD
jgi:hypothetical protein